MTTPAPIDPDALRNDLVVTWLTQHPREERPHAVADTRFRHSHAGKCSRFIQYEDLGVEASEPFTPASLWIFQLGQLVHDEWQAAFAAAFGAACTLELGQHSVWMDGSCSLDARVDLPTGPVVVELKSINGMGYKASVGALSRPAEGPRHDAKLQAAMNACATPDCLGAYVVYVSTENISPSIAERKDIPELGRFMSVWWLPIEECVTLATPEFDRLTNIGEWVDSNEGAWIPRKIPSPDIPKAARITNPSTGAWQVIEDGHVVDVGNTWHCNYCKFQSRCQTDG